MFEKNAGWTSWIKTCLKKKPGWTSWLNDLLDIWLVDIFGGNGCPTNNVYALVPAGTIVKYSHDSKSLMYCCEQILNLHII